MCENRLWDWRISFTPCVRHDDTCAGFCNHASKVIEVSTHQSDEEIRDTCLHEIAHALVGVTNPYDAHDEVWQKCFDALQQKYPEE